MNLCFYICKDVQHVQCLRLWYLTYILVYVNCLQSYDKYMSWKGALIYYIWIYRHIFWGVQGFLFNSKSFSPQDNQVHLVFLCLCGRHLGEFCIFWFISSTIKVIWRISHPSWEHYYSEVIPSCFYSHVHVTRLFRSHVLFAQLFIGWEVKSSFMLFLGDDRLIYMYVKSRGMRLFGCSLVVYSWKKYNLSNYHTGRQMIYIVCKYYVIEKRVK